jgi:hypothetical protein
MINNPPHCALIIVYSDKCTRIEGAMNSEFLGLQIDHSIMWKNNTDQTIPQFSGPYYTVRLVFHISDSETQINLFCLFSQYYKVWNFFFR